ncbi:MATH and LRR domain-containing protein PFE0570w-like [Stegodyphus dumicola]|uniref:MATH and LRR domain-containing protein PFE0570w-like n=1 Tax=Stegodyphus dumicola TaxID=202533 RepID=UPI0015AAB967|nr:MATH and LRR domain-containing protein PFE0570w-like [Stegodyphus dumicola]
MAQKGFASNNSLNMDSFLHVDKEIEFIVDDSSSQYSFAVPTEKTLELSRKTYSKKNPITYHHYSSSPDKMQVNGNTSVTNTCILNQRNSPVEQKKLLRGKRSKDSHPINSKSMPPKRMKRKETNDIKIIHHKINVPKSSNKFYKGVSNSNLVVDPEIEIIEIKQNSPKSRSVGLLETNITVTPNYCSAKGKAKDKLDILQKKKNPLKMVPQPVSEPCYPSNDEVLINEADTAPIMPSSDIPDGTVIEASNSMINASTSRKWLSADGTVRFSQLNSDNSPAAKGAKKDGGKILLPSQKKFEKSRELRRLYNNLNEISWFHEKSFQKLLVNKKGHIQHFDKNLRHIKSALLHRLKRQPMKKSAAKIVALKKTKIARLKHKVPAKRLPFKQVNKKVLASKQISKTNTIKQNMNVIKKHGTSNLRTKKHIINRNNNKKIQNMKKGTKINSISKKYINAEIRKENIKKGVKIDKGKQYINARIKKENNNAGIKKRDINAKNKKENASTKSKKENGSSNAKKTVNASPKKLIVMHIGNKKDNVLNTSDKKKVVTSSEKKINSASTSGKKISITAPLMKKANAVTPIMKKTSVNISDKKLTAATNFKLNNTDPKNNIKKSKVMPKIVYRGKNKTVPSSRMDFSVASGSGLQNACNIFKTDVCSSNPSASLLKNMYKNLEKVEISNEVDIYRRFISGEKEIYSAFQRGSKLRVTLEPLEHTDWWTDECYESVKKEMLQQALLKGIMYFHVFINVIY